MPTRRAIVAHESPRSPSSDTRSLWVAQGYCKDPLVQLVLARSLVPVRNFGVKVAGPIP